MIGVHNWGFNKFWIRVFDTLGLPPSKMFTTFVDQVNAKKVYWKSYHGSYDVKGEKHTSKKKSKGNYCTKTTRKMQIMPPEQGLILVLPNQQIKKLERNVPNVNVGLQPI